jgi:hypothetical protein
MWQKMDGEEVLPSVYEKWLVGLPRIERSSLMRCRESMDQNCPSMAQLSLVAIVEERVTIGEDVK